MSAAIDEQIAIVARRVGSDAYQHEVNEVRLAGRALKELRGRLGLRTFVGSLNLHRGKPQLLLVFERRDGERVVLKIYGRPRPNESLVQATWAGEGVAMVPVLASGDNPVSWLLMPFVEGEAVDSPEPGSAAACDLTVQMATELAVAHTIDVPVQDRSPLSVRLRMHYGATFASLTRHGYVPPRDWWARCTAEFDLVPTAVLHGDLAPANLLRIRAGLRIFDTCGYVGPAEYDAARWCARVGGWKAAESLLVLWLGVEASADPGLARRLLGCELMMEAGVREVRKDESGLPWSERDPSTQAALDRGIALLS